MPVEHRGPLRKLHRLQASFNSPVQQADLPWGSIYDLHHEIIFKPELWVLLFGSSRGSGS